MSRVPAIQIATHRTSAASAYLAIRLRETYGLPDNEIRALDDLGLIRAVATLDFLSNNLPVASQPSWIGKMLP
jgi:hypothetical protein